MRMDIDEVGGWLQERLPGPAEQHGVPGVAVAVGSEGRVVEAAAGGAEHGDGGGGDGRLGVPDRVYAVLQAFDGTVRTYDEVLNVMRRNGAKSWDEAITTRPQTADGTLLPIDRGAADRPFSSGKHKKHG